MSKNPPTLKLIAVQRKIIDRQAEQLKKLSAALNHICETAMDHPAFDGEFFEMRDQVGMAEVGGEVADWTGIAIIADDALKGE